MFHHVLNQGILSLINYTSAGSPVKMEENNELVFASFNQDTTSLAVGTTNGYKLYSLTSTDSLEPIYSNGEFTLLVIFSSVCEFRFYKMYFKRWNDLILRSRFKVIFTQVNIYKSCTLKATNYLEPIYSNG